MVHFILIVRFSENQTKWFLHHWNTDNPIICRVNHCMCIVYGWHVLSEQHHFLWKWQFTTFIAQISRNNAMNLQIIETNKKPQTKVHTVQTCLLGVFMTIMYLYITALLGFHWLIYQKGANCLTGCGTDQSNTQRKLVVQPNKKKKKACIVERINTSW